MNRVKNRTRLTALIVLATLVIVTSACSLRPDDLPSPKGGVRDGYDVSMMFDNALNLPTGASVMMDGLRVGEVKGVTLVAETVRVATSISSGTVIPADSTATIRQDTVLGDTYVAIERPASGEGGAELQPGGVIPVSQTTSPPQLEDTLAVLANFVNGGNIQKVENSVRKLNAVMPDLTALQRLASTVAVDLDDLAMNTREIDRLLTGLDDTAVAVNRQQDKISMMLSSEGVVYWDRLSRQVVQYVGTLLPSIGSIFAGGAWMVPMLNAVDRAVISVRQTGIDALSDSDRIVQFLRRTIIPFMEKPSAHVGEVVGSDDQQLGDVQKLLRMLGATK
ncbi:MCE family protein [Gordonia terrae]|uniref:MCE family protein n=1 Tax=Gordonia terrae TaxID=2055 RepID=A0A2I1R1E8_9ACTN|nr:MlaD family protein [Gordonia terrae]PKZ62952.1 MCE family protein [Gordonia terrae]